MDKLKDLLKQRLPQYLPTNKQEASKLAKKNITQEYQDYGLRLASRLGDLEHKSMYIKYAKTVPRALIDDAAAFATDYPKAKNKGKIFMWKLSELVQEYKAQHPQFKIDFTRPRKAKRSKQASEQLAIL